MVHSRDGGDCVLKTRLLNLLLALSGIAAFFVLGVTLEREFGIKLDTTYRLGCAGICLTLLAYLAAQYRGERWPWIAFALALLVNLGLFLTPLFDRPASRGEIMLFAFPDTILFLTARIATYRVADVHQRAMRQQMALALLLAVAFGGILFFLMLIR